MNPTRLKPHLASLILISAAAILAQPCSAAPRQWDFTGSLNTARVSRAATLLPNGNVLVAGGDINNNGNATATAEIYNPATGRWTFTGSMAVARDTSAAILLTNGKVLVAGGYPGTNDPLASAELYDSGTGVWSSTGSMNVARAGHSTTLLPNGMVLVAGGLGANFESLKSAELYDPATGTWTLTGSLNTDRNSHTAILLPNGMVLVAGGAQGLSNVSLKSAELYDPSTGAWSFTGNLKAARRYCGSALLKGGTVLIVGGIANTNVVLASAEVYNPATGTWSFTGSLGDARFSNSTTFLADGTVLVAGGLEYDSFTHSYFEIASAEHFDPAAGAWSTTGSLNTARAGHSATLLLNGMVLVAAGAVDDYSFYLASAEVYDPGTTVAATQVSGRGSIAGQGGTATFSLQASDIGGVITGSVTFKDAGAGVSMKKGPVRSLTFSGNSATLAGTGRLGSTRVTYNVTATDNSSSGSPDTLSITLSNGYSASGPLTSGDVSIQ